MTTCFWCLRDTTCTDCAKWGEDGECSFWSISVEGEGKPRPMPVTDAVLQQMLSPSASEATGSNHASPGPGPAVPLTEANGAELARSSASLADLPYLPLLGEPGWFVEGWSHLVAGYPRVGKTDLLTAILRSWLDAGHSVVYITEEPRLIWEVRLATSEGDWSRLNVVFGLGAEPDALLLRAFTGTEDVVVLDALRNLLRLQDEKDNSEIARVATPWITHARERGKTLVIAHHGRKGGGDHGEGIAGGHALLGAFDIAIEVLREPNAGDNHRRLRSYARLIESRQGIYERVQAEGGDDDQGPPPHLPPIGGAVGGQVGGGVFRMLGEPGQLQLEDVARRLASVLDEEWQKQTDLRNGLDPKPGAEQTRLALNLLASRHEAERSPPLSEGSKPGKTYFWRSSKTT